MLMEQTVSACLCGTTFTIPPMFQYGLAMDCIVVQMRSLESRTLVQATSTGIVLMISSIEGGAANPAALVGVSIDQMVQSFWLRRALVMASISLRNPQSPDFAWVISTGMVVLMGDFDGDGRSDIVYYGRCGSLGHSCLCVPRSDGKKLCAGENWGDRLNTSTETSAIGGLLVGDFDGDGKDDIMYRERCGKSGGSCWRVYR